MVRVFTEEDLTAAGYVEVSPGIFERPNTKTKASALTKQKEVPKQFSNLHSGKYEIDGKVYKFRSGWEYIFAQFLQILKDRKKIKDWEYECKRFEFKGIKRGCRDYLPDFKVIENDGSHWWAEVKGYLDQKGATRLNRMKRYFPEEKVRIIRKEEIDDLKRSGLVIIPKKVK